MKSRPKWFLRRSRQDRSTTGSDLALADALAASGVLTAEQLERAFERERARVERNQQCFSLAVFRLPEAKTLGSLREGMVCTAEVLLKRIRTYDDVGLVDHGSLAVLLPETSGPATWMFADGALADLGTRGMTAHCEVYTYPHPDSQSDDESHETAHGADPFSDYGRVDHPRHAADSEAGPTGEHDVTGDTPSGSGASAWSSSGSLRAALENVPHRERPTRLRALSERHVGRLNTAVATVRTGRREAKRVPVGAIRMTSGMSAGLSSGSSALAGLAFETPKALPQPETIQWRNAVPRVAAETRPVRDLAPFFEERLPLYRRTVDVVVAGTALTLLSPVLVTAALLVKLTSPGPIIFAQARAGRGGRPFQFYKLRSMYRDAEDRKNALRLVNEKDGPIFKIKNDPRITPVGKVLRKFSIDELPQLVNVLKGDMTLVGPRPPVMDEIKEYETWQRQRLDITGGITCIWQVSGRSDVTFREWMRMDVRYRKQRSLGLDLKLVWKTFGAVFSGKGAY